MRSTATRTVNVTKISGNGDLPPFLGLIVRHFEKSRPSVVSDKECTLSAPLDLLELIVPTKLLNALESIEIKFRKDT